VGRELNRMAVALHASADAAALHIVYRLHPSESAGWQERYPELAASGLEVEPAASRSLYASQADADVQVGVYSTSLLEGLAFGLPTFTVDLPGSEQLDAFVARGLVQRVAGVAALAAALERVHGPLTREQVAAIWSPDPVGAFRGFVERALSDRLKTA
jgi:hypothetical protein